MVADIQFDLRSNRSCQVDGCTHKAFIKCSHCGKILCYEHFLSRTCFHNIEYPSSPVRSTTPRPRDSDSDGSGAGAAVAASAAGTAIGIGAGAGGAAIATSGVVSGTAVSGSTSVGSKANANIEEHELQPLLKHEIARSEEVLVVEAHLDFQKLVRDKV